MGTYGHELQPLVATPKHRSIPITFWQVSFSLIVKELRGVPKGTLTFNFNPYLRITLMSQPALGRVYS